MTRLKTMPVKKAAAGIYSVHPGVKMVQNWIATLQEKTGRTLPEWIELIQARGPKAPGPRRSWLQKEFQIGDSTAAWLAQTVDGDSTWDGDPQTYLKAAAQYVENMYAGAKSDLRPLHDRIVKLARKLGRDVKVCPCKTIVPLYRKHVFAEIKPAIRTRIDLGLALHDTPFSDRLLAASAGSDPAKKQRITHRLVIASLADIDDEVRHWLHMAYELDS
jgi:hypothetical protein